MKFPSFVQIGATVPVIESNKGLNYAADEQVEHSKGFHSWLPQDGDEDDEVSKPRSSNFHLN